MDFQPLPSGYQLDESQAPAQTSSEQPPAGYQLDSPDQATPPPAGYQLDDEKYSTPLQQAGTMVEGAAQGYLGPLATLGEKGLNKLGVPGFSDADITGRRNTNPTEFAVSQGVGLGAGLLTGTGEAGLIAKGLSFVPKIGKIAETAGALTRIGGAAIKGALQMGLIQGGDEISKGLLDQGDPEHPVSTALYHMGAAALLGAVTGGIFSTGKEGLQALGDSKFADKLNSYVAGGGFKLKYPNAIIATPENTISDYQNMHVPSFNLGQKGFSSAVENVPGKIAKYGSEIVGSKIGGVPGFLFGKQVGEGIEKLAEQHAPRAGKYLAPILLKAASSGPIKQVGNLVNYANSINKGNSIVGKAIEAVFRGGPQEVFNYNTSDTRDQKLKDFIEEGGTAQQLIEDAQSQNIPTQVFAEGGKVLPPLNPPTNLIEEHFPEQNIMLNSARSRISGYLSSLRPSEKPKLPFDSKHVNPHEERNYNKAIKLANNPISILGKVKDGSLTPKDMQHFTAMYPELHRDLSKRLTKRIFEDQLKEETKPKYGIRQALSLFTGSNLDSSLTPQNIQAAQMVFAKQNAQRNPPPSTKAPLSKAGSRAQTPSQARDQALNKT